MPSSSMAGRFAGQIDLDAAYRGRLTPPDTSFWLPGLSSGVVAGLIGDSQAGKTWLGLLLAHDWALGGHLTRLPIARSGSVAYVAFEGGRELPARLESVGECLSPERRRQAYERLAVINLSAQAVAPWSERRPFVASLAQHADVVILDNLRRMHTEDENDNTAMSRLLGDLQSLAESTDTTILVIHHVAWGSGNDSHQPLRGRGASAIMNAWRWVGSVQRNDGVSTFRVEVSHDDAVSAGTVLGQFTLDVQRALYVPVHDPSPRRAAPTVRFRSSRLRPYPLL